MAMLYFDFTLSATPPPKSGVKGVKHIIRSKGQAPHQVKG